MLPPPNKRPKPPPGPPPVKWLQPPPEMQPPPAMTVTVVPQPRAMPSTQGLMPMHMWPQQQCGWHGGPGGMPGMFGGGMTAISGNGSMSMMRTEGPPSGIGGGYPCGMGGMGCGGMGGGYGIGGMGGGCSGGGCGDMVGNGCGMGGHGCGGMCGSGTGPPSSQHAP